MLTRQGWFVRRRVDLKPVIGKEGGQLTDIDLYAVEFDHDLSLRRMIGEAKAGTSKSGPKPGDRLLWLSGLMRVTDSHAGVLITKKKMSRPIRQLADRLSITVYDQDDLERRELALGVDSDAEAHWGPHHPDLVARERAVHALTRQDQQLERVYWYFRSDYWHLDPVMAAKRTLTALEVAAKRWVDGLGADEVAALAWLIADGVTAFTLTAVTLARGALIAPEADYRDLLLHDLSGGTGSPEEMARLSSSIDRYLLNVFQQAGVSRSQAVAALGAFAPRPPSWALSFAELLGRLAERPEAARDLPRTVDLVLAQALKRQSTGSLDLRSINVLDLKGILALARQVVAFLRGHVALPEPAVAALMQEPPSQKRVEEKSPVAPQEVPLPLESPADGATK